MTTRRAWLIACGSVALATSRAGHAQTKVYRIGILQAATREDATKLSGEPFLSALAELGFVDGRNLVAAARYGMQFLSVKARNAAEFDEAAVATRKWNADAVYINSNPPSFANRKHILALLAEMKKPAMYWNTSFVEDGGLIAYAVNFP